MEFYKLPVGIQETKRKNSDGSEVIAFRVQMNRKKLKFDKLYPTIGEALRAINEQRKKLNLKGLVLEEDKEKKIEARKRAFEYYGSKEGFEEYKKDALEPIFSVYVQKYIDDYLKTQYRNLLSKNKSEMTAEEKHKFKNYTNKINKYERMVLVKLDDIHLKGLNAHMQGFNSQRVALGSLRPSEITPHIINSYVRTRIQDNLRGQSIRVELVLMNSVFLQLKHMNSDFKDWQNPIKDYDKKLLSIAVPPKPKFFRFKDRNEEDESNESKETSNKENKDRRVTKDEFLQAVETNKNPDLVFIVKLMMLTAMRRAEVVLLKWSQIYSNFIQLTDTKTNPRPVYLSKEAIDLIKSIPKKPNQDRLFDYTVTGFEASLRYHLGKFGLKGITAHKLRKNSISEFVEIIGADNSLLISEILGIRDIAGLEKEIQSMPSSGFTTQKEVLKSVGHTSSSVTKRHYFSLNLKKTK